jgi:hypothetical protein
MKTLDWKETAELIGLFAILASLIFVALQLRQQEELLNLETRNNMVSNTVAVNEQIIGNSDIWVRGNAGKDLNAMEFEVYLRMFINLNDQFFQTYFVFHELYPEQEEQILSHFAGFLARNPGAYRVWIDRERQLNADRTAVDPEETITSEWIEMIEARIAIIKSNQSTKEP